MKIVPLTLFILLVCAGRGFSDDTPATIPAPPIDPLIEALPILQKSFVHFSALAYKPGDKLSDLITRSKGEITLAPEPAAPPILATILPGNLLYWRLASFTPEKGWLEMGTRMQQQAATVQGVILDLRSNLAPDDYHGADQVLNLFPLGFGDPTLIQYRNNSPANNGVRLEQRYSFHVPIVVLVNSQTTGAAEALAACLQADGAVVVGRPTACAMGVFQSQKLSNGQVLRYFVSPVWHIDPSATFTFPTHHDLPWGRPITPDIAVKVDEHIEKAALILIKDQHIADVIGESPERHRLSEAALLLNQDPEWDDYLNSLQDKPVLLTLPVIHDSALITALDSLRAIRLSQLAPPQSPTTDAAPPGASSVQ